MKIEPLPLENTVLESSTGKKKKAFSLSAATDATHSFLYFGIHGAAEKIELSDADLNTLEQIIKELRDARSKQAPRRIDHDRR